MNHCLSHRPVRLLTMALIAMMLLVPLGALLAAPVAGTTANARSTTASTGSSRKQGLLAAFKGGKVWLMNADGSNARALPGQDAASNATGPRYTNFAWSPSGRYLLLSRQDENATRSLLIYDTTSGQVRTLIDHTQGSTSAPAPTWARNEDTILASDPTGARFQMQLKKLHLDGTTEDVTTYTNRADCGGLDGPASPSDQQFMLVSRFYAYAGYPSIQWSTDSGWLATNTTCHESRLVDVSNGDERDLGLTPLTVSSSGRIAGRDSAASPGILPIDGKTAIYDPGKGATVATTDGVFPVWSPDGKSLYFLRTSMLATAKVRDTDDGIPYTLKINKVEVWRVDANGKHQRRVATLRVYAGGLPTISSDGKTLVFATVQNLPHDLKDVPGDGNVSGQWMKDHTPEIHLQRVDLTKGKVTRIAVGAYAPQLQPTAGTATSQPATTAPTKPVATTAPATGQASAPSTNGWIAYTGDDHNLWVSTADGARKQQITTDGTSDEPYHSPSWSHDGSMLVFSHQHPGSPPSHTIMLLKDGKVSTVNSVSNCKAAAFTKDDAHLVLLCGDSRRQSQHPDTEGLLNDPHNGMVSIANLDGSGFRVLAPFPLTEANGNPTPLLWNLLLTTSISVAANDGSIAVNTRFMSSAMSSGIFLFSADGKQTAEFGSPLGGGAVDAWFAGDGKQLLANACTACHRDSTDPALSKLMLINRGGKSVRELYSSPSGTLIGRADLAPDGKTLIYSSEETAAWLGPPAPSTLWLINGGDPTNLAGGFDPAWQPGGKIALPGKATTEGNPTTAGNSQPSLHVEMMAVTCRSANARVVYGAELPSDCAWASGIGFTVTDAEGDVGSCTTDENGQCLVAAPADIDLTITEDTSTAPDGYAPQVNPLTTRLVVNSDAGATVIFVQVPAAASPPQAPTTPATQPAAPATQPAPTSGPATPSGAGWIAYTGEDGNIWLMRPDGTDKQQITTNGTPDQPYERPSWSADGTMLVFVNTHFGFEHLGAVYLLRDGKVSLIPNLENCSSAAFMPDGRQLALTCGSHAETRESDDTQSSLDRSPGGGFISVANLDGSDWRVLVPYHTAESQGWPSWASPNGEFGNSISVASDGMILVNWSGTQYSAMALNPGTGAHVTRIGSPLQSGSIWGRFASDGASILAVACPGCHVHGNGAPGMSLIIVDRGGQALKTVYTPDPSSRIGDASMSPDGSRISFTLLDSDPISWTMGEITVLDSSSGATNGIIRGGMPAWQPVAAEIAMPNGQGGAAAPPQAASPPAVQATNPPTMQATVPLTAPVKAATPEASTAEATQAVIAPVVETAQAPAPVESTSVALATPVVPEQATEQPGATVAASGTLPTGGQLAYGVKAGGHWDVWVHDFGSGQNLQLTTDPNSDQWAPVYSHDGSQLAFLSDASGSNQVWLMDPDGGNQRQVSDWSGDSIVAVAWSADDQTFYVTVQGDAAKRVMQMPAGGGDLSEFIPPSSSGAIAVPGQSLLVYVTDNETTPQIAVAPADNPAGGTAMFMGDAPAIGGSLVACQVGDKGSRTIVVHDLGGNALPSPAQNGDDSDPALTPDGSMLFYVADNGGPSQVMAWPTSGGDATAVDVAANGSVWYIAWRPNS